MNLFLEIFSDIKYAFKWFVSLSPKIKKQKYWMYGFIVLVICVLFLISHSTGNNDLTNWIIALANIVMAVSAIMGIIYARQYVKDLAAKDGYKVALKLKQETIPSIPPEVEVSSIISNLNHLAKHCVSVGYVHRWKFVKLFEGYILLNSEFLRFDEVYADFIKSDKMLSTCNWSSSDIRNNEYANLKISIDRYWLSL